MGKCRYCEHTSDLWDSLFNDSLFRTHLSGIKSPVEIRSPQALAQSEPDKNIVDFKTAVAKQEKTVEEVNKKEVS